MTTEPMAEAVPVEAAPAKPSPTGSRAGQAEAHAGARRPMKPSRPRPAAPEPVAPEPVAPEPIALQAANDPAEVEATQPKRRSRAKKAPEAPVLRRQEPAESDEAERRRGGRIRPAAARLVAAHLRRLSRPACARMCARTSALHRQVQARTG